MTEFELKHADRQAGSGSGRECDGVVALVRVLINEQFMCIRDNKPKVI